MVKYIIDAHLPYYFSLWAGEEYVHVSDLNEMWTDTEIWDYAKDNQLTIVTKDTDFSDRILLSQPPPHVIHIKFGNMKMREFHQTISSVWNEARKLSKQYKLVRIFKDRVEGIN
jgi:predicted nuclease of predicted toxin-antitoxin system